MNPKQRTARQIILVTGAARSGKSEWAEILAAEMGNPVTYIATAQVDSTDKEWQARIEKHQQRRPSSWQVEEVPVELATTLDKSTPPDCLLVDSLGTWVANLLTQDEKTWEKTAAQLLQSLQRTAVDVILVAEEAGWGVVPAYEAGRQFRDRLGMLVRQIGAIADRVYLVTGGYALDLSLLGQPLPGKGEG